MADNHDQASKRKDRQDSQYEAKRPIWPENCRCQAMDSPGRRDDQEPEDGANKGRTDGRDMDGRKELFLTRPARLVLLTACPRRRLGVAAEYLGCVTTQLIKDQTKLGQIL